MVPRTVPTKLVLLGESAVGKSSLALRYTKNAFDTNLESTIGAAFLTRNEIIDPETTITLQIWDTAGQERYRSLAPMYYRNSAAAVVVFDVTNAASYTKAQDWIIELKRQADSGIIIALVGNKCDLEATVTKDNAPAQYAEANGLLYFEASAKTGKGVEDIFSAIAKKVPLERAAAKKAAVPRRQGVDLNSTPQLPNNCNC